MPRQISIRCGAALLMLLRKFIDQTRPLVFRRMPGSRELCRRRDCGRNLIGFSTTVNAALSREVRMQRSLRRSIYGLTICVLVTGCDAKPKIVRQIEDRDKQIADIKWQGMQLAKRKSALRAEQKKSMGKATPAQDADWKAQIQRLDSQLQQNGVELDRAQKDRARELNESQ